MGPPEYFLRECVLSVAGEGERHSNNCIRAHLHLVGRGACHSMDPHQAGTDIAMMLAVAYVLFNENLYDTNFVSTFVEPTGFQKWKDYVMGNSDGTPKTPQWAEVICGVPAATIQAFAELYAKSSPVFMRYHWSAARAHGGENNARVPIYLQAMTGNVGIPGSFASCVGFNFLGGGRILTTPSVDTGSGRVHLSSSNSL